MSDVQKIRENLYLFRVEIPIPSLKFVNVYAFRGPKGITLIDTGWDSRSSLESFLTNITKLGINPRDIRKVIITHFHMDHLGLTRRLKNLTSTEIIIHGRDKQVLKRMVENSDRIKEDVKETMKIIGLPKELYENVEVLPWIKMLKSYEEIYNIVTEVNNEEEIENGEFNLRLIWTPGHTPGH
ncbi:MAG: MBL fold metallo-hydrolase, partial [Sulfolobales archaeon]